jgi:uncharacterized protein (TIGR02246 family)
MKRSLAPAWVICAFATVMLLGCVSAGPSRATEDDVLAPVNVFVEGMSNADLETFLSSFSDDALVFMPFTSAPRRLEGKQQIRETFAPMFESLRASGKPTPFMKISPRDVTTRIYGDTAIVTFHLGEVPPPDATGPSSFSRRTFVLVRSGDGWRIVHLHASNMTLGPAK